MCWAVQAMTPPADSSNMKTKKAEEISFKRGYFMAVANLMQLHDASVIAVDVLRAYGPVDLRGIDENDRRILRPLIAELKRQAFTTEGTGGMR